MQDFLESKPLPSARRDEHGVALIIILCFVALATVLVVAFLASVKVSGVSENAAASENSASQLAATAVQLVEGTITYATEPRSDTTFAWACQPGMIRTYGSGANASADPLAYYKLYSSDNMVLSGPTACNQFTSSNLDVPKTWDQTPALFTDLNTPITTSAGTTIFPILDPRAVDLGVEGFRYTAGAVNRMVVPSGRFDKDSGSRMPMPVKWMYVLRDGSITAPDSGDTKSASWKGTNIPTALNPIVGRVAFWTDDESAKVNVNTASEGTYWDTPISNSGLTSDAFSYPQTASVGDVVLANYQGAQHEYQRYPGHPATTSLSAVFGNAVGSVGSRADIVKAITDAAPRITDVSTASNISGASSMGGTQDPSAGSRNATTLLATDFDRLYASLDEFQFMPSRSIQTLGSSGSAQTMETNIVDTCRFFLTAHSKAPELNLFGLPRVAMWPLWDDANATKLTSFDREVLRCSTVAAEATSNEVHRYAFFRENPLSSTDDWNNITRNKEVYGYLRTLMNRDVPGYGKSFANKYGTAANSGVTDSDQILTEIMDYIRCTNLADNSDGSTPYTGLHSTSNITTVGQVVPLRIPSDAPYGAGTQGFGRIANIGELALVLTKVDDRLDTNYPPFDSNANPLVYLPTPAYPKNTPNRATSVAVSSPDGSFSVDPSAQTLVEWCLVPRLESPMCGYVALSNNIRIRFTKINMSIGGNSVSPRNVPDLYDQGRLSCQNRDAVMGGNIGYESLIEGGSGSSAGSPSDSMFPTGLCVVPGTSGTGTPFAVSGDVTIQVFAPAGTSAAPGPLFQTYNFSFPANSSMKCPVPQLYVDSNNKWFGNFRAASSAYTQGVKATYKYPASANKGSITRFGNGYKNFTGGGTADVVRSLTATGTVNIGAISQTNPSVMGDTRVIGTMATVPANLFQQTLTSAGVAPTSATYAADAACMGTLINLTGDARGSLSALIPASKYQYPPAIPPLASANSGGVVMPGNIPGDWDNGVGLMYDGPWINKPDEGMTESAGTLPYIGHYETMTASGAPLTTLFSPNRQVSSPVMFGSLLAGSDHPWRTLLFRPAKLPGYQGGYTHPGNVSATSAVPDHVLLDLFWMPVVEPYGISEPLATSGKINLNYQLQPFTYITRRTGLHAVMKAVMITALNPSTPGTKDYKFVGSPSYKWSYGNTKNSKFTTRYPIDSMKTLDQLEPSSPDQTAAFPEFSRATHTAAAPNFFVSASQICDVPLVPIFGPDVSDISAFWAANSLTGDNSLERPYSMIYPRVTTKSNIFTVHVLAQSLKKIATDAGQNTWNENRDQVLSEYRAAYTIEKYLDPNLDNITDEKSVALKSADDSSIAASAGLRHTKWRLLNVKRFGQ